MEKVGKKKIEAMTFIVVLIYQHWLNNFLDLNHVIQKPTSSDLPIRSLYFSYFKYWHSKAKSSQTCVSVFSISASDDLLTKWTGQGLLRYPSAMEEHTLRDNLLIWSERLYFSSTGKLLLI
jgi:hypothetical protein